MISSRQKNSYIILVSVILISSLHLFDKWQSSAVATIPLFGDVSLKALSFKQETVAYQDGKWLCASGLQCDELGQVWSEAALAPLSKKQILPNAFRVAVTVQQSEQKQYWRYDSELGIIESPSGLQYQVDDKLYSIMKER